MLTVTSKSRRLVLHTRKVPEDPIEALYRTERARLTGFARRKGASEDEAEEVVQEAFFKLARYGCGEKIRNDIAFVRTIIVNLIRDKYRVAGHRPAHIQYDELTHEPQSEAPEPEMALSAQQELKLTLQDINQLPVVTREVFLAYRLNQHTYNQIADDLGITIALVRRHLRDALLHLATQRGYREN